MGLFSFLFGSKDDRDGSSPEREVVVAGVPQEYAWLHKRYSGFEMHMQALQFLDERPFDVLHIRTASGDEKKVYFDISSFFGR